MILIIPVAAENLSCKILALTSFNDDHAMLNMLHAGAFGFLLKSFARDEIINTIRVAAAGGRGAAHVNTELSGDMFHFGAVMSGMPALPGFWAVRAVLAGLYFPMTWRQIHTKRLGKYQLVDTFQAVNFWYVSALDTVEGKEEVMRESQVLEELEMFGSSQWGLVTVAQARALGVERLWLSRMSTRGMLQRIRHGVYALPSAQYGPLQDLQAAWLATDASQSAEERLQAEDPVVVSHVSAAGVHQLGDLLAARHEFSSPARRQTTQKDLRFHRREAPARDITWVEGLPVTSVARTVGDLAAHATDFDHLATVVRDAVEGHHVKVSELAERLFPHIDTYGAASGAGLVQSLLDQAGYTPEKDPSVNKVWDAISQEFQARLLGSEWSDMIQASIGSAIGTHLAQWNLDKIQNFDMGSAGLATQQALRRVGDDVTGAGMLPPETVQGLAQEVGKIHPDGIERALAGLSPLATQSLTGFHSDIVTARNESQSAEADEAPQEEDDTDHDA